MKAIRIKDKDINSIELGQGKWLIDGEPFFNQSYSKKTVEFKSKIQKVETSQIPIKYACDNSEMSVDDFIERKNNLLKNKDEDGNWDSIESEFEYRKLTEKYIPIFKTIETVSDPLIIEFEETILDTGNKFIISEFANATQHGGNLYIYHRGSALLYIVDKCFSELGMSFNGNCGYDETKNKKVWGNSTHSCIEYVTAFGTYIFSKIYESKNTYNRRGSLEQMTDLYNSDVENITKIIKDRYTEHFGRIDIVEVDFQKIMQSLRSIKSIVSSLDVKKSCYDDKRNALNKINETESIVLKYFKI